MFGVFRVMRDGSHLYMSRSATANEKLAREIAADRSNGIIVMPDGSTRRCKAYPHVARSIMPDAVEAALRMVTAAHPNVVRVTFYQEDADCGGLWAYEDANGDQPTFGPDTDVDLLESALDAAYEHAAFPAVYFWRIGNAT